jgi:hypothetical protein
MASRLRFASRALDRWLDRHRFIVLVVITLWLAALVVVFARGKAFWHDEVYTILTAELPIATFWRACLDGVDLSPPLNTALTHVLQKATGVGLVVTRLPAMVGLLAGVVLLFLTVRRRTNTTVALGAALTLCFTPAWEYGFEARGYGLTLGLFAAVLYSWSETLLDRRRLLHLTIMAMALAAGVWAHYYAALAFLPIIIGEATRQAVERRVRMAPWVAVACAGLATVPLAPLMLAASTQRHTFWTHTDRHDVSSAYVFVLGEFATFPLIAAVVLLIVVAGIIRRASTEHSPHRLPASVVAACIACAAIPGVAVLVGELIGAFTERYLVFATVGCAFAAAHLLWRLTPDNGLADTIALAAMTWALVAFTVRTVLFPPVWRNPVDYHPVLTRVLEATPEPVTMTGSIAFLGVWYGLPAEARRRVIYLADPEAQIRATQSDTVDRAYLALARWTAVPVVRVSDFARAHDRFLLYSFGSGWAEQSLRSMGGLMIEQARFARGGSLYDVTMRPAH